MRPMLLAAGAAALALSSFAAIASLSAPVAHGDDAAPKSVAGIKDVMLSLNDGDHSLVGHLRETFNGEAPDDDGWNLARARATMLMEASVFLWAQKPPLGADDAAGLSKWHQHVLDYRGCADAVREAAVKKDLAAGKAALMSLAKRCKECHTDHRKEE